MSDQARAELLDKLREAARTVYAEEICCYLSREDCRAAANIIESHSETSRAFEAILLQEKKRLFRPIAAWLAEQYEKDCSAISRLCDDRLDMTGNLLGWVRDEAAKLRESSK